MHIASNSLRTKLPDINVVWSVLIENGRNVYKVAIGTGTHQFTLMLCVVICTVHSVKNSFIFQDYSLPLFSNSKQMKKNRLKRKSKALIIRNETAIA